VHCQVISLLTEILVFKPQVIPIVVVVSRCLIPPYAPRFTRWSIVPFSIRIHPAICTLWQSSPVFFAYQKRVASSSFNFNSFNFKHVRFEFDPSSAVICIVLKRFKRRSAFNSEPPSDHRSNFDLGSSDECRNTIAATHLVHDFRVSVN